MYNLAFFFCLYTETVFSACPNRSPCSATAYVTENIGKKRQLAAGVKELMDITTFLMLAKDFNTVIVLR